MVVSRRDWLVPVLFAIGACLVPSGARAQPGGPALEGPTALEPIPDISGAGPAPRAIAPSPARERAPKSPPPPLAESPGDPPSDGRSQWVGGSWTWDADRRDFAWVPGAWRVAPGGMIWVEGRWARDADGWYRIPGFWSPRQQAAAPLTTVTEGSDWRRTGPPANRPDESPGPAPGADYFYIPGEFTPDGDRLAWKPGFWAKTQPGWDWLPARWVRRGDGWDFRPGNWTRDGAATATGTGRYVVSRPAALSTTDLPRDPIAEAEAGGSKTAVLVPYPYPYPIGRIPPGYGYGYGPMPPYGVVVRPPGYYPYGSRGVILPPTVPRFVPRLLNRVLP